MPPAVSVRASRFVRRLRSTASLFAAWHASRHSCYSLCEKHAKWAHAGQKLFRTNPLDLLADTRWSAFHTGEPKPLQGAKIRLQRIGAGGVEGDTLIIWVADVRERKLLLLSESSLLWDVRFSLSLILTLYRQRYWLTCCQLIFKVEQHKQPELKTTAIASSRLKSHFLASRKTFREHRAQINKAPMAHACSQIRGLLEIRQNLRVDLSGVL